MRDLITDAMKFANKQHVGQVRKYTGLPYITHPMMVAEAVSRVGGSDEMIAAAWLHDVVEDTPATHDDIHNLFGSEVCELVISLTDISRPEDGNRAARKAIDRGHIGMASPSAKTIKLADLIDNSSSIAKYDPEFAKVYMEEKTLLLMESLKAGNIRLWNDADRILIDYYGV